MRDCPFCGAHMTRLRIVGKWAGCGAYRRRVGYVRCLDCNARGPLVEYKGDGSEVTFLDVRNEAPPKGCKAEIAFAAQAARAWDAKREKADPAEFRLEGGKA